MPNEELVRAAVAELRDIDRRRLFWVDIGTGRRDGASVGDVAWEDVDWEQVRTDVERWLEGLNPDDGPAMANWPIHENLVLIFQARPRTPMARGWPKPSLTIAETPVPDFYLASGEKRTLHDLSLDAVRRLATGAERLALELPSHRETFEMLADQMEAFGQTSTAQLDPAVLETYASILGLTESPPELGDFDEGWRAINDEDFPLNDDPR